MSREDDEVFFAPEDEAQVAALVTPLTPWAVLIVDDEPYVHTVTMLALAGIELDGRRLRIEHAYSGAQARAKCEKEEWALILLDVVMQTEDDGLRFLQWLRKEKGNQLTRVVLRTGQPGAAPEREVMLAYDLNDYQPKSDLSAQRLSTSVVGALRAWRDLRMIEEQRSALQELADEQRHLLTAFGRFVPQGILSTLGHATPLTVSLGDHITCDLTLLFLDVRAFTPLSERLGAARTFAVINQLFGEVVPLIHQHGGLVDKYLGDGLLALFKESPEQAVRAAQAVIARIDTLGALAEGEGGFPERVDVGIGIHFGQTVLGLVGTADRLDPTVIADAVNVGSRLERLTRLHEGVRIVASEAVVSRCSPALRAAARPLGLQSVRGRQEPVDCFDLTLPAGRG